MKILSIETSTLSGGVALMDDVQLIAEYRLHVDGRHAGRVMVAVDFILNQSHAKLADLDAIAVSVGPGSFTGLRVGLATAKGLAMGAAKPLVLVSTLEVMAAAFPHAKPLIVPFIDARQSEVYWALFDYAEGDLIRCHSDSAASPKLALDTIFSLSEEKSREVLFVGDGALKYRDIISGKMNALACFPSKVLQFPSAAYLAELGLSRLLNGEVSAPELAEPVYLRASAAELKRAEALAKDK